MIRPFLEKILTDPFSGAPLVYDAQQNILRNSDGVVYSVNDDVPLLLPSGKRIEIEKDELHHRAASDFNYIEHYTKDAETFDYFAEHVSGATRNEILRLEQIIASHVPPNAETILDVGCGNGWVANLFSGKQNVISMDISSINAIKVHHANKNKNHNSLVADIYHLPLKPESIDCIIASEIIEHVADPELFISKLYHVLKPGGTLIITTPYKEKIEYYLCVHCNKPTPKNAHLHSFDEKVISGYMPALSKNKITTFSNKWLLKLRSYKVTRYLPLSAWKLLDIAANAVLPAPTRIMIRVFKPE
ncbi:MAG: class I SAM-dependent methyltransferase [Bacteroidota bacterium]